MIAPATLILISVTAQYNVSNPTVGGVPVVVLEDRAAKTQVSIAPSIGNIAYSMKVNGVEIFWSPYKSPSELKAKPALSGIPFLAPWANRIEGMSYWANGKEFTLNPNLGNLRLDGNKNPIHGLVIFSDSWKVVRTATDDGAVLHSRLELYRDPKAMAQFPFAHAIDMTYRLRGGALEVITEIENLSSDTMPVAIGYHPYYQLPGGRDSWQVRIPATEHVELSSTLIPTGKLVKMTSAEPMSLNGNKLDDVYTGLVRGTDGNSEFSVSNGKQKLSLVFGPKFQVGVVYAPPGRDFICFEPMAGITDAFNQNHRSQYTALQSIPAGGKWRESWWVKPSGF